MGIIDLLPEYDLAGNPRINGIIDMGAYEYCVPDQPGEISGNSFPCESSTQSYSVISVPDISYFWELPTGWIINSGQGSNSVIVTAGSNSGQLSVTPSNACGDGQAQTLAVTVINLPAQANQPVGPDFVDLNYVNLSEYITQVVANADYYNWILEPATMGTISGNGNEITILWSGILGEAVLSVQAINTCGEGQISEPLIVQIDNSVGLEKPKFRNLNIYPNPSDGTFTVTGISYFDKIELIGSLGTIIKTISNNDQNAMTVDLSDLQPGIYQIKLTDEKGIVVKRLVKK